MKITKGERVIELVQQHVDAGESDIFMGRDEVTGTEYFVEVYPIYRPDKVTQNLIDQKDKLLTSLTGL